MTRIVLAEDHSLVRDGLRMLLTMEHGMDVAAETGNGADVERLVREARPDLLLLDLDLPGCHGIELATRIKSEFADLKILVLTGSAHAESVGAALAAGADGYVVKLEDNSELLVALQAVLAGRQYVSKCVAEAFRQHASAHAMDEPLTERERRIVGLVAQGANSRQIADRLYISVLTVRTHRHRIMSKLGLRNAAELTAYAIKAGLSH